MTIIVLLILAVVTIKAVTGDGIIIYTQNSKKEYLQSAKNEQSILQDYVGRIDEGQLLSKEVKDNLNKVLSSVANITVEDKFGNPIKLPAGFKILVDSTTDYTKDDIDVTKGIVVEDENGNQFVWIPVGQVKNEKKTQIIKLERNTFGRSNVTLATTKFNNIKISRLEEEYKTTSRAGDPDGYYFENLNFSTPNSVAKDIEDFCSKATASGGYYIGRYEARTVKERTTENEDTLTEVTSKANDYVYNYVTQPQASKICQNMYINSKLESDLINSYAWDTAIVFFQEFGGNENSNYASKESVNNGLLNTGTSGMNYTGIRDKVCNVYDIASNCGEWTTETYSDFESSCVEREAGNRSNHIIYYKEATTSFRMILYM